MKSDNSQEVAIKSGRRLPSTPEGMINLAKAEAINVAYDQIRKGQASSQVLTHFLKIDPEKERLERVLLERKIELTDSQIKQVKVATEMDKHIQEAIEAMGAYRGVDYILDDDDEQA